MQKAGRAKELPVKKLRWRCPLNYFDFRSTADIPACEDIIGQDRALEAIKMGLELKHRGYNIFITGLVGTGRTTTIKSLLEKLEKDGPIPPDICYMHNFKDPNLPRCIELEAGRGVELKNDMDRLVKELGRKITAVFGSDYYKERRKKILDAVQEKQKEIIEAFEKELNEAGFAMVRIQMGPVVKPEIVPVIEGNPVDFAQLESMVEKGKFPAGKLGKMKVTAEKLNEEMAVVYTKAKGLEVELRKKLEKLDLEMVKPVIHEYVREIEEKYKNKKLSKILADIEKSLMSRLDLFRSSEENGTQQSQPASKGPVEEDPFREYRVNVVVDNSETNAPPVVIENFPSYKNLFGTIERDFTLHGIARADHMSIRAGSFHRANGGYLVLNALDVLIEPGVWQSLKRTLKSSESVIQGYDPWSLIGSSAINPEPIDISVKIVLIGDAYIYHLLYERDDDFRKIFKIRADFDREVDNNRKIVRKYAGFIRAMCDKENLKAFDRSGVAAIVEYGVRLAGRQKKLSTRFSEVADVVREADYHARKVSSRHVKREHVEKAVAVKRKRSNLLEEKIRERVLEDTIMIDTSGAVVGQVNALSVYDLGDYMFGMPSRITVRTSLGSSGVINIEREAKMSGRTHDKGVLILSGYLRGKYGNDQPIVMSASICFEQSYSGVDGDSASSTELYAILSSLAELPVRQDIAVTGSINQRGEIQPIGGVNEKIEGFFRVCKERGIKGTEGVIIPRRNVQDLMLDEEVIDYVSKGKFHIYPIDTVEEGISILTGVRAGKKMKNGKYPRGTVNELVQGRLAEMAKQWKQFGKE
ncbi:MAG: ATP-dependent protease [Candidatus Latescibacteria bacterium 4484_7]|nr:MAG: ATP-dependent protease [Candidatus Latescibacteria bacterium 4484_7]RKZ05849.1 MAG: ATP-dependent protease [bacterium]